jgi:outer membrane cobalamin receptor
VILLGAPRPTDAASVQGRATDPDGAAVVGAQVRLVSAARAFTTNTGPDGTFALDLPAGTYRLFVLCPGLRAAPRDVVLATDASVTIDLPLQISAVTETIVVSAAQAEGPLSATPASVTVVSGDDLAARQVDTLSDALRAVPGFSVATSGSGGALTSVFPRGGESDYTLVLLDGIRLNSFGGGLDFATLASASVDRIEVVRGPQSAVYGADAIGGVVQVITRQDGQARVAGTVAGGSADTAFGSASVGSQVGRWSWGAGGEGLRSDN